MDNYRAIIRRRVGLLALLVGLIIASMLLDFTLGPSGLSLDVLGQTLLHPQSVDAGIRVIVWDIRMPVAVMAIVVGASLSVAGAQMQTILANPLASPFTLGISAAASF